MHYSLTHQTSPSHLLTTGQFNLRISPSRTRLLEHCALSPSPPTSPTPLTSTATSLTPHQRLQRPPPRPRPRPHPTHALTFLSTILHPTPSPSLSPHRLRRALALSETSQIHSHLLRRGCHADILLGTTLIDATPNAAILTAHSAWSKSSEALALFNRMRAEGEKINEISVLGALAACSQLGALRAGEGVHACVRKMDLDINVQYHDLWEECGHMEHDDHGLCNAWRWMQSSRAFEEMGKTQAWWKGVRLFDEMVGRGVNRNVKHYGSVVDLLGRAGGWSLLGACKTYGNVEMAEMASRKLVEMGSNSCGDFVLLSNVYAARERWEDVGRVREAMKSRDVRKVPGFSYIEVEGVIHKFVNGDQSHPDWREIYAKLDEIRFRIKAFGYVAETSLVLHDIGEEDKENALCHHSEKLAVAFGLISTSEGTPIRVNKNLRICGDCHVVIKLISKIYDQEIIVRDRARFHRFKDGSCSCRDYW
ncbi:Pentatricopeptide repeat-containing protein [Vitis vinifera]|uniref:Pentatricopeptide repeat-containing protein n=1 Tax=Vitis vinifera TaxID=29760 RepID=A0A438CHM4_VITVI|nr:Pentatricopeptide repeat-containing protein [Vitis vinifera]